uniref:Protein GLUTAMINE DUMPER 3 n=1 Tax=Oryza glumipatula TaxID=40148 RepID=A0A0D9YN75_9ORYZ
MRPGAEYAMVHGGGPAAAAAGPSSSAVVASTASVAARSPWQSPVPYLFGGLAAMLGLIALSLLALACSYWKLAGSGFGGGGQDGGEESRDGGGGGGEKGSGGGGAGLAREWRDHVVVIMAGDERPTFLATPASSRAEPAAPDVAAAVCCSCGASSSTEVKTPAAAAAPEFPAGDGEVQAQSPSEQTSSHSSVITS